MRRKVLHSSSVFQIKKGIPVSFQSTRKTVVSLAKTKKTKNPLPKNKQCTSHLTHFTLSLTNLPFCCLVTGLCSTLVTPWTTARLAPLFMGFPRQDCWSGLPFPTPGNLPSPGIKPGLLHWQAGSLPLEPPGKPYSTVVKSLPVSAGDARDLGLIPGSGRFPGVGNGNPLQ